jgi:ferredoxin-NADP reductase
MKLIYKGHETKQGNVERFIFTPESQLDWQPGQYIHYKLQHEGADNRGDERWFTISSAPFEKDVWITTRITPETGSSFKKKLIALQPGESVEAGDPEGSFTINDLARNYIFVAGGIGITPFRSIINQLHHDGADFNIELLYANRDGENIPFKDELEAISKEHANFNISYFIGDNKITEAVLREYGEKLSEPIYYVSGPEPMVEAFQDTLKKIGIDEDRMKFDYFPGYEAE